MQFIYKWALAVLVLNMLVACSKDIPVSENHQETLYVNRAGANMPAFVHGNALSKNFVIIVHGGPGGANSGALAYRSGSAMAQLEEKYAFVYWDQRGQGSANGTYSTADVTIDAMVEDLRALVLTLKAHYGDDSKIFVLGHSWGGTLGTAFMVKNDYQHLVNGWIEANGAHDIPLLNKEAIKLYREVGTYELSTIEDSTLNISKYRFWNEVLDFAHGVDTNNISIEDGGRINSYGHRAEGYTSAINYNESVSSATLDQGPVSDPIASTFAGNNLSNLLYNEVETSSYTDQLYKIEIPCLFIWGEYDFVVPPALGYDAYDKVSASSKTFVLFEESGHSPMDNEPDKFVQTVVDFVDGHQ